MYPLRSDYETVVKVLDKFVYDDVLRGGKAVAQKNNPNFLRAYSGGKAVVFEIKTNLKKYALKCWVEDLGDLKDRYKAIDNYLKQSQLDYFVDFAYVEQGIFVKNNRYPIVRMEWVDGVNLKSYIDQNIDNTKRISDLAEKFLEMVGELHKKEISHGDLQHGNVLIRHDGTLCLIDYDSLYVPELRDENDVIKGLPGYQHRSRSKLKKLSPKVDFFSELVIYLSLHAIAEEPGYWKGIKNDWKGVKDEERLLFSQDDLANPNSSEIFGRLRKKSSNYVKHLAERLSHYCNESSIENLLPLEKLIQDYDSSKDYTSTSSFVSKPYSPPKSPPIKTSPIPKPSPTPHKPKSRPATTYGDGKSKLLSDPWVTFGGNKNTQGKHYKQDKWARFDENKGGNQPFPTTYQQPKGNIYSKKSTNIKPVSDEPPAGVYAFLGLIVLIGFLLVLASV